MDVHNEIFERMRRAVGRAVQHLDGLGLDASALEGQVVLTIQDGQLVDVRLPGDTASLKKAALDNILESSLTIVPGDAAHDALTETIRNIQKQKKSKGGDRA